VKCSLYSNCQNSLAGFFGGVGFLPIFQENL
jgi:hypothetical protein